MQTGVYEKDVAKYHASLQPFISFMVTSKLVFSLEIPANCMHLCD